MAKRCTCEGTEPYGGSKTFCDCGSPPGSGQVGCIIPFVLIIGGLISLGNLLTHFV